MIKRINNKIKYIFGSNKLFAKYKRIIGFAPTKILILTNSPRHGNLGDHALFLGEKKLLEDELPDYKVIELPSGDINVLREWQLRLLFGKLPILIHAGGFLGTIWPYEEEVARKVLKVASHNQNKVIIMPQTVTYSLDEIGKKEKAKSKEIYGKLRDISVFVREQMSVEVASELVGSTNVFCVPDMVVSFLPEYKFDVNRENLCVFCMRADKEKSLSDSEIDRIQENVKALYPDIQIEWVDTVVPYSIKPDDREDEVKKVMCKFATAKLVITDRLHGMVFAARTGTPCIAFDNSNKKVSHVYEWIKELEYVKVVESVDELTDTLEKVVNASNKEYPDEQMRKKSEKLIETIRGLK